MRWLLRLLGGGIRPACGMNFIRATKPAPKLYPASTIVASILLPMPAESTDHVLAFFRALKTELAFYVGCVLHDGLRAKHEPIAFPEPTAQEQTALVQGLYDVSLSFICPVGSWATISMPTTSRW